MKRAFWIVLVAVLQVLCLVYMAAERECVIHYGRTVWIRTAPVDPRDAFRGDYVRLLYPMNQVTRAYRHDGLVTTNLSSITEDTRVYATLSLPTGKGLARLHALSDQKPTSGLFLRGRTGRSWGNHILQVRYGIEAFFVEQGEGLKIEAGRRHDGIQVPLEMRVAVGRNGLGVLTGYRWSELGIGLVADTTTNRPAQTRAVTVRIVNVSTQSLAIVNQPGWTFTLENDTLRSWANQEEWEWVGASGPKPPVTDADVVLLAPGQDMNVHIDLTNSAWFVKRPGESPRALQTLNTWGAQYRIQYQSPTPEECRHLLHARNLWHGDLLSPAFGGGRID